MFTNMNSYTETPAEFRYNEYKKYYQIFSSSMLLSLKDDRPEDDFLRRIKPGPTMHFIDMDEQTIIETLFVDLRGSISQADSIPKKRKLAGDACLLMVSNTSGVNTGFLSHRIISNYDTYSVEPTIATNVSGISRRLLRVGDLLLQNIRLFTTPKLMQVEVDPLNDRELAKLKTELPPEDPRLAAKIAQNAAWYKIFSAQEGYHHDSVSGITKLIFPTGKDLVPGDSAVEIAMSLSGLQIQQKYQAQLSPLEEQEKKLTLLHKLLNTNTA